MSKILLIEKTNMLKFRLEKLFTEMGFSEIVTCPKSGFDFEKTLGEISSFHTIVVDYDQSKESFNLLIQAIDKMNIKHKVKLVVLTSTVDVNEMMIFFTKGVDEVVLKPFNDKILNKKLNIHQNTDHLGDIKLVKDTIKGGGKELIWCSGFEIGVEEIDNEHKEIIDHFITLYTLMRTGKGHEYFSELIKFLDYYVHNHFNHEEKLHTKSKYTKRETHKIMHDEFKTQVETMIAECDGVDISNADLVKLNLFIKEWLVQHILTEDKKFGEFMKKAE